MNLSNLKEQVKKRNVSKNHTPFKKINTTGIIKHLLTNNPNDLQFPLERENKNKLKSKSELSLTDKTNELKVSSKQIKDELKSINKRNSLFNISGNEDKVMRYLFERCEANRARVTRKITIGQLIKDLKIKSKKVASVTLARLSKKRLLLRKIGKRGKGGFSIFEIPQEIYKELTSQKITLKDYDNNIHIFDNIIIPTRVTKVGFGKTQIEQLKQIEGLSVETIQETLEHLDYDLGEKKIHAKTSPLNLIMGCLRKKHSYISSEYSGEKEKDLENQLRLYRERKKRIEDMLKEYQKFLFEDWLKTKTKEQILALTPSVIKNKDFFMKEIHKEWLFDHFVKNEMQSFEGQNSPKIH